MASVEQDESSWDVSQHSCRWSRALATLQEPGTPGVVARAAALSTSDTFPPDLSLSRFRVSTACATLAPVLVNAGSPLPTEGFILEARQT